MHSLRDKPLVFVDDLSSPVLSEVDYQHLAKSRRLADGSPINLSDGLGQWRSANLGELPQVSSEIVSTPQPKELTVCFAPVKGERSEWTVQKLTELGATRIIPFVSERSVVRWDSKKAERNHQKFEVVVREACMQSRRLWLPQVSSIVNFDDLVKTVPGLCLADPSGEELSGSVSALAIGPEGGFSAEELNRNKTVSLGAGILRAETAALAAAVLMSAIGRR